MNCGNGGKYMKTPATPLQAATPLHQMVKCQIMGQMQIIEEASLSSNTSPYGNET
jgi:hypothetical protein